MLKVWRLIALLASMVMAAACTDKIENPGKGLMSDLNQVTAEQWRALSERTIYFGHQSVGANIMEGLTHVAAGKPQIKLRVASGHAAASPGVLNEFAIGENADPD